MTLATPRMTTSTTRSFGTRPEAGRSSTSISGPAGISTSYRTFTPIPTFQETPYPTESRTISPCGWSLGSDASGLLLPKSRRCPKDRGASKRSNRRSSEGRLGCLTILLASATPRLARLWLAALCSICEKKWLPAIDPLWSERIYWRAAGRASRLLGAGPRTSQLEKRPKKSRGQGALPPWTPRQGKRVKGSRRNFPGTTETDIVAPVPGPEPATERCSQGPRKVVRRTTTQNPLSSA